MIGDHRSGSPISHSSNVTRSNSKINEFNKDYSMDTGNFLSEINPVGMVEIIKILS